MADDDYCYLTTTGRRTGEPHRIEIWYARDGERLYLLSGAGRRSDWVRNLEANNEVSVEVDGERRDATARVLDDSGVEEARARQLLFEKYQPRYTGDLSDWRDSALPVALDECCATGCVGCPFMSPDDATA
ncbi:MAG: nitroreductase family deazaflavin-dependent oxidoreductase [Acidimicrobiia bacterium]